MHFTDNIWVVVIEGIILFGLIIAILVKIASTMDK
jgi:F0F1-type ATP synthase membrane subunit c/vacuolar-type H+-ATPase subunit K